MKKQTKQNINIHIYLSLFFVDSKFYILNRTKCSHSGMISTLYPKNKVYVVVISVRFGGNFIYFLREIDDFSIFMATLYNKRIADD